MKLSHKLDYKLEDVFYIFVKAAKRDFPEFNEENPKGIKMTKKIGAYSGQTVECTVEISDYVKNEKYEITTSSQTSKCVSTYTFKKKDDNSTLIEFKEVQHSNAFIAQMGFWVQRFLARRNAQARYKANMENLENELKTYLNNLDRSAPKK